MSTKIGHFEILSELAKSATGAVYKANDPESGQTVALKAIQLSAFGEKAAALQQALTEEAESTKSLASPNITPIFGAGEMDGQFCVAMEYVQGNSIATMLARKEGFSIWDLLDIGRQVCSGLDQAHAAGVHHYSLEPAKIMCAWDGSIKILSMGASSVGKFVADMPGETPSILHYMSPEQVLGDKIDGRSNLFSIGAMFYEMVTDRKAFEGVDVESVRQRILDSTPIAPVKVNAKLHPLLSDLIMKALSKDPAERFQNGRELLDSLEKCKESKPQAANKLAPKPLAAAPKPPAAAKAVSPAPAPTAPAASRVAPPVTKPAEKFVVPAAPAPRVEAKRQDRVSTPAPAESLPAPKAAAAAAAGWGTSSSSAVPGFNTSSESAAPEPAPSFAAPEQESPYMSAAVAEPPAFEPPKLAVDPMMAEDAPAHQSTSTSFSEISELPPLKEIVIKPEAPPPPPPAMAAPVHTQFEGHVEEDDKPRVNPREVAQKAIKEVKNVPPQLMLYSILGAVALILIVTIWLWSRIGSGDDDSGSARPAAAVTETQPASAQSEPVAQSTPQSAQQTAPETHEAVVAPRAQVAEPEPEAPRSSKTRNSKKKVAAPVIVPGQMTVDSTPQGAQVQLDGATDPTWVTPLAVSSLDPGPHSITISKSGYVTDSRTIKVVSGSKSSVVVHLNQLSATLSVTSNPPGANIYVDGRDMGKLTPAQVSVDKGQHVVLIRKAGYIDETASAQFALGQTVALSPTLRAMGNVDNIRTVGKMKKLFGGNSGQPGQGTLSIRTQPKGAQVAVNQHMLDKGSPVEVMLDPGNYVIDISLSGYAPISKVVTVDKGGKAVLDETMQPQ
jgi:eukaryotic-like serine/threonine-protein kinase